MCISKDFMGEEGVWEVDRPRKQVRIKGLIKLDRTPNTSTRLNGAPMDTIGVNNDELQWWRFPLDSLQAPSALMAQPLNVTNVDQISGNEVFAIPHLNPVEGVMDMTRNDAGLAESRRVHTFVAARYGGF